MYDVHHKQRYRELPVAVTLYTYQFGEQAVGEEPNAWGYSWYPNLHDSLELLLMERGCVHWIIGEQEFDPVPGDLLVVNPFELHASTMKATDSVAVYYLIHIDLDEYPHALGKTASDPLRKVLSGELAFQTFFPAADVRAPAACIRELHEEFSRGGDSPAGQCRIQSLVFALLGELLEHCHPTNRSGSDLRRYAFMNEVENTSQ